MSASDAFENDIALLIFQNVNIANLGDAVGVRGSTAAGSLFVALHSADPGEGGNQSTSEVVYTGYARVGVVRTAGGWAVSGNQGSNVAAVTFGACTAGSTTATFASIGTTVSGATRMLASGALSPSIVISPGVTPALSASTGFVVSID